VFVSFVAGVTYNTNYSYIIRNPGIAPACQINVKKQTFLTKKGMIITLF
jgi:hypothetical protein